MIFESELTLDIQKERDLALKRFKGIEDYLNASKTNFYSISMLENLLTDVLDTISDSEVTDTEKFLEFQKYYNDKDVESFIQKKPHLRKLNKKNLIRFIVQSDIINIRNELASIDLKLIEEILENYKECRKKLIKLELEIQQSSILVNKRNLIAGQYANILCSKKATINSDFESAKLTYDQALDFSTKLDLRDHSLVRHVFTFSSALERMILDTYLILFRDKLVALNEGFNLDRTGEIQNFPPNFMIISPELTDAELISIAQTKNLNDGTTKKRSRSRRRRVKRKPLPISSLNSEEQSSLPLNSAMKSSFEDQKISNANKILEQKEEATEDLSPETLLEKLEIEKASKEESDLSSEKSFSNDEDEEKTLQAESYALDKPMEETSLHPVPSQKGRKVEKKTRKIMRYQKQSRPEELSNQSKVTVTRKAKHKGKHKKVNPFPNVHKFEKLTPVLPIYLTEKATVTFEKLGNTSYRQKVTVVDYYDLLKDFIRFNLNGYLRKVVQRKNRNSTSAIEFNLGEGESLVFLTYDNRAGYLSFHIPHDHDGSNHRFVPKEYRKEYMGVFDQLEIKLDDITVIEKN